MLSIWFNKISEILFIGFGFVIFTTLIGGFVISPVIVAIVSFNSKKPKAKMIYNHFSLFKLKPVIS